MGAHGMTGPIPHLVFTTAGMDAGDRTEAWRQNIAPIVEGIPQVDPEGLEARLDIYHLGTVMVGGVQVPAHRFRRDRAWIAQSGADHYFLQMYLEGGYRGRMGEHDVLVRRGDIEVLHLGQTFETEASSARTFGLLIPKDILDQRVSGVADLHGTVLRRDQPAGRLLGDHLLSLHRTVAAASQADAAMLAEGCLALTAATLRPSAQTAEAAGTAAAGVLAERIGRYIDAHLVDPELDAARLCQHFRLSRSYLYRLFESQGGVAQTIRRRRLGRALAWLRDPQHAHARICDVAYACGFGSEAGFTRAFRAEFGLSPSELRLSKDQFPHDTDSTQFAAWVAQLGRPLTP